MSSQSIKTINQNNQSKHIQIGENVTKRRFNKYEVWNAVCVGQIGQITKLNKGMLHILL